MNAVMAERDTPDFQDVCTIVVLYEGDATRARAMAACDYLVRQFWQEVELQFHWWRTDFLRDTELAALAADNAVQADFLIISSESPQEFAPALESWFESWLERRTDRQGALVDLAATPSGGGMTARAQFLQEVSRRGKFDYLTAVPQGEPSASHSADVSPARHGIIDDILGESRPPSHFGLNE